MKTGGTLNFLKRAGAILMLLAVFASSCNKYADDFKQLNTKLDALATQVAGVTQLTTDVTALKSQITALQTAVAGLPNPTASIAALATSLTAATTKIDAITTSLAALSTAVASKASTADITKAVADVTANVKAEMTKQLATLATGIADANKAIAAAQANNDAQTVAINKAILDNNTAQTALLNTAIANLDAHLTAVATGTAVTDASLQSTVDALALLVKGQKTILDQLLANSNMYNGDVIVTSVPEMRFYLNKLSQLGIVNGNVVINTTNLTTKLDSVNMITSKITSVIGTQAAVKNSVTVTSVAGTVLDLSKLVNVAGAYSVTGVDISDDNLSSVGGNFTVNYDGAYTFPNLSTVGGDLTLTKVTASTSSPVKSGTTSISLPNVVVTGNVYDGVSLTAGVLVYPNATAIVLSGGVNSLTAAKATTITLGSTSFASGLMISAPLCTTLNIALATSCAGVGTIITASGCAVDFSKLATAAGGLTITGPTTLSFPVLASGSLTSSTATTVTLPVHDWVIPATLTAVTNLTLGKVTTAVAANNYPTLTALAVTGKSSSTWAGLTASVTATASNTVLASVTLGGNLVSASISGCAKLTSLTTAGIVNSLTIDSNTILAGVTLAHTHYEGGPGSDLVVTNNVALTSLTTSTDKMKSLVVTGNTALTSLNMASYINILNPTSAVTLTIGANKLSGTYKAPVPGTATTPLVEGYVTSADLATIKAYVAKMAVTAAAITLTVTADLYDCDPSTSGAQSLVSKMVDTTPSTYTNVFGTSKVDTTAGINSASEFTLVQ